MGYNGRWRSRFGQFTPDPVIFGSLECICGELVISVMATYRLS